KGLEMATRNAQDGISYIQTAEGATNEISSMLVRLKELAVQVQNGTYSTFDQANIGEEMKALGEAAQEIIDNTKFNGIGVFTADTDIKYGEDAGLSVTVSALTTTNFTALKTLTDAAVTAASSVTVTAVEDAIT